MSADSSSSPTTERFAYVDGMRGIAALGVAVAHLVGAAVLNQPELAGEIPALLDLGRYGVQIFFVLSGFVIAHSVNAANLSWNFFGRFAARRSVRLDIPYWLVIAGEIVLLWMSGQVLAGYDRTLPSVQEVAANAFYLQMVLGFNHILPIFWTLCYEIQFYLAFVASLIVLRQISTAIQMTEAARMKVAHAVLGVSFVASLVIYVDALPTIHAALFDDRWFQFALGVITYAHFRGYCSWRGVALANGICVLAALTIAETQYRCLSLVVTAGTSVAIVAATQVRWAHAALSIRPLLFLGTISYSLYLLHLPIGWRVIVLMRVLTGQSYGPWMAIIAFVTGIAVSIAAAWALHRLVEVPTMRLARNIRLPRLETSLTPQVATSAK